MVALCRAKGPGWNRRHRALRIDSAADAILALDNDRRVSPWNWAAQCMFGWTAAEVTCVKPPLVPEGLRVVAEHNAVLERVASAGRCRSLPAAFIVGSGPCRRLGAYLAPQVNDRRSAPMGMPDAVIRRSYRT